MEKARSHGETAIGYLSADGPLHLAPPALQRHTYEDGDRVIVVRFVLHLYTKGHSVRASRSLSSASTKGC